MTWQRFIETALVCGATTACSLLAPSDSEFLRPPVGAGTGAAGGVSGSAGTSGAAGTRDAGSDSSAAGRGGRAGSAGTGGGGAGPSGGAAGDAGADAAGDGASDATTEGGLPLNAMVLWLTATRGVVHQDGPVSTWEDQSGSGNHATQNAPRAQPWFGGHWTLPTIDFDGEDDFFSLPAAPGFADFSRGMSAFFATESHGGGPCQSWIQFSNGPNADEVLLHRESAGDLVYQAPQGLARCSGNVIPENEPVLISVVHAPGGEARLFVDGVHCGGGALGALSNVARNSATIGRAADPSCSPFSGHIGEVIVYGRALDDRELEAVHRDLQIRWDL